MRKSQRERLIKLLSFLEEEIKDYSFFKKLNWKTYLEKRNERRNVERWIENLVNVSIDVAKVILTEKKKKLPETYREMVYSLSTLSYFSPEQMEKIS
jgi:uncharacterized protein YutE (UPF0331/DUF86 family)